HRRAPGPRWPRLFALSPRVSEAPALRHSRPARGQFAALPPSIAYRSLDVNLQPAHGGEGIAHRFPNGWMRVNHIHQVVDGSFEVQHGSGFRENFRRQRPDDVNAQDLTVFFVAHNFNESAVIPQNCGLAIADERELANFHGIALILRLFLGKSDGTNLRLRVGGVRNAGFADLLGRFAGDVSYRDDAFHHGGVRKLRQSRDDVADRVQAFLGSLHVLADVNESALDFRFGLFEAAVFRQRHAAHGQQQLFRLQRLRLA